MYSLVANLLQCTSAKNYENRLTRQSYKRRQSDPLLLRHRVDVVISSITLLPDGRPFERHSWGQIFTLVAVQNRQWTGTAKILRRQRRLTLHTVVSKIDIG